MKTKKQRYKDALTVLKAKKAEILANYNKLAAQTTVRDTSKIIHVSQTDSFAKGLLANAKTFCKPKKNKRAEQKRLRELEEFKSSCREVVANGGPELVYEVLKFVDIVEQITRLKQLQDVDLFLLETMADS